MRGKQSGTHKLMTVANNGMKHSPDPAGILRQLYSLAQLALSMVHVVAPALSLVLRSRNGTS